MADVVSVKELKKKIDEDQDFLLVDVLSENSFSGKHVPGAINVPFSGDDFPSDLQKEADVDKKDEIIVYCSSETCQASPNAAKKLEEAGYSNVKHFKRGLAGWQDAGYEFES